MPESIVDLHDLHTVPRAVLKRLIADGKRVGRLVTPYREHLAQHFAGTSMRIGLPEPYKTEAWKARSRKSGKDLSLPVVGFRLSR